MTAQQLKVLSIGLPSQRHFAESICSVKGSRAQEFSKIKGFKLVIPVDPSVSPHISARRRLPLAIVPKVDAKLDEWLESKVIIPWNGPSRWISPMVIVTKDNGDIRLCLDLRQVNKAIRREIHPMPLMDNMRAQLNGADWFSKLDLKDAFTQLEIAEESQELLTFITHRGLFRFVRLIYGLCCAPELFQKIIESILAGIANVIVFIDDMVVFGKTIEEHNLALEKVLERLTKFGVLLNAKKCIYRVNEIDFLGHRYNSYN